MHATSRSANEQKLFLELEICSHENGVRVDALKGRLRAEIILLYGPAIAKPAHEKAQKRFYSPRICKRIYLRDSIKQIETLNGSMQSSLQF